MRLYKVILKTLLFIAIYFDSNLYGFDKLEDPYPDISIPVYSEATNIHSYMDKQGKVKSKSYIIKFDYPAEQIINFHNSFMRRNNFIEESKKSNQNEKWFSFQDATKGHIIYVRQFTKSWLSSDGKKRAIILLRNEALKKNDWSDNLLVTVQIMTAFNEKALDDFIKKLKEKGKYQELMNLLDKYTKPGKEIDYDKAIKENPNNQDIIKLKKIMTEGVMP